MTTNDVPPGVAAAYERARHSGFALSCEPEVGRLLATLAAAVPEHGAILEMGTGVGVGCAWIVHGLGARSDGVHGRPRRAGVGDAVSAALAATPPRCASPTCSRPDDRAVDLICRCRAARTGLQRNDLPRCVQWLLLVDDMMSPTWIDDAPHAHRARAQRCPMSRG
jgi:hypothetical protein